MSSLAAVEDEVGQIHRKSVAELRLQYRTLYGAPPPRAFGPDLLRRSIAYKLQLDLHGEMPRWARSELDQRIKGSEPNSRGRIELPRRIKPGSVLMREWKAKVHRVTVLESGFSWNSQKYDSLSEIARAITGTRWNGPRFFGLRTTQTELALNASKDPLPRNSATQ